MVWNHVRSALALFRAQKIRFLLTVSGIVVGVFSLLVMASLLSVGQEVLRRVGAEATGDDLVTIENDWGVVFNNPDARGLDRADLDDVRGSTLLPSGRTVTATYGLTDRKGVFEGEDFTPLTIGVGPEAFDVYHLEIGAGRTFNSDEYADRRRVVVVGAKVLEGALDPGDTIRVEGAPFVVVGVLEEKPEMGPGGHWSWNNRVLFPAGTYAIAFDPTGRPTNIVMRVEPPVGYDGLLKDYVLGVRDLTRVVLMNDRTVESFRFSGVEDASSTEAIIFTTIEALLYLTTVFSMIVGGINIMNIMLVTVTERTREIGLRRACGATRGDILRQFLAETVIVALIGAAMGVAAAVVVIGLGAAAMTAWVTPWPFRVEPWSLVASVGFSSAIGLVFGTYPAWRASRLDPVEALRSD